MNKMSKNIPVAPRPASTVLLLREQLRGFEVFLLRRHNESAFMAGNYVYPGGAVDKDDEDKEMLTRCTMCLSGVGNDVSRRDLLGYRVAAIRELFEEAGVLLAYRKDGTFFRPFDEAEREKFARYRRELNAGQINFLHLLSQENLILALDNLLYYAHWITPEARPIRFDTRFFVALHHSGQEASPDQEETTDGIWIAPRSALEANIVGSLPLSPPTLKTLEDVACYDALQPFLESLRRAEKRIAVLPVVVKIAGEDVLIFPWDPDYDGYKKGALQQRTPEVSDARPSCPSDNTTRLIYRRGLWLPFVKNPNHP